MNDLNCNYLEIFNIKNEGTNRRYNSYGRVMYSISDDGESFWFSYWPGQLTDDIVSHIYGDCHIYS